MKIFPENSRDIEYVEPSTGDQLLDVWKKGDFLRKTAHYLKDTDEKELLICKISDLQGQEWPTPQIYSKKVDDFSREISDYISTHEDPFKL